MAGTGTWDLFLTDINPHMWAWASEGKSGNLGDAWIQWHGTNLYGMSCAVASNYLAPSQDNRKGHAAAMGRGVYSTTDFQKAVQYSPPHIFQERGIKLVIRCVLLASTQRGYYFSKSMCYVFFTLMVC